MHGFNLVCCWTIQFVMVCDAQLSSEGGFENVAVDGLHGICGLPMFCLLISLLDGHLIRKEGDPHGGIYHSC